MAWDTFKNTTWEVIEDTTGTLSVGTELQFEGAGDRSSGSRLIPAGTGSSRPWGTECFHTSAAPNKVEINRDSQAFDIVLIGDKIKCYAFPAPFLTSSGDEDDEDDPLWVAQEGEGSPLAPP